jgi:hypothetical protein
MMKAAALLSFALLALGMLHGCAQRDAPPLSQLPTVDVSADATLSCGALRHDDISRITGARVVASEPSSKGSGLCHFTLENGEWFNLILIRWPDVKVYTSATCDDRQNGPTWGMIHHPFCSALAGPYEARVQSSRYFGMSKDKMKPLLDEAVAYLAHAAGAKVLDLN